MGGLGKTTIARKAYNHVDTKRCFQGFAWVCITQQCQIRSVLEDVLRQLNPLMKRDDIRSLSMAGLIQQVCQIQKAKPCIIVLDDLWKTDHWDDLKQAFLIQDVKSKILVTTRNQNVAKIGFPIQPRLLSSDSGWELLKRKAFSGSTTPGFACDENLLMKIGKEMVQKCGFLPLTICLLGGVLSKRKSTEEWELVKENVNAYLYRSDDIEKENEIHGVLYLSYEDLPHYLKPCFLYLGLFKEDEAIHARDLYRMWIAQGMISHENASLVVIAELYLSELASRSFVELDIFDEYSESGEKYSWCKLHDAMRVLCLRMGKMEGFGLQSLDFQDGKLMHGSLSGVKTRHLAVRFQGENESQPHACEFAITSDEDTCKQVRSLLLLNSNKKKIEFLDIGIDLQNFKLVRILYFLRVKFGGRKLPKGIGNLIHLRYLCFKKCELDELPSTIRNLSYLQTLDLSESWNVRVPNVFNKLLRLKHLLLPQYSGDRVGDYALELDEGLDELETLAGFDRSMHQLKCITRLKNLRKFEATARDNKSLSSVIDDVSSEWSKLKFCSVFIMESCQLTTEEGLVILKRVLSCRNLHQLYINSVKIGKRLDECRNCVCSSRIVSLYLVDCEIEDDPMTILAKLPVLKELFLLGKSFLGEEITCPALSFPRLTQLSLRELPNLREWRVEEGAMPLLSEIEIEQCPNLIELPDGLRFISKLKKLTITGMQSLGKRVLASEDESGEREGEDFDKVRHVPSIIINN